MFTEGLKFEAHENVGDPMYALNDVRAKAIKLIEIDGSHWLALRIAHDFGDGDKPSLHNCVIEFGLFEFAQSDGDGSNVLVTAVFQGEGPTGSLRECRHINWGPDGGGYTFYLPANAVIAALTYLADYYDF